MDPDFESNRYVYIYFTQVVREIEPDEEYPFLADKIAKPVVMRYTEVENRGVDPSVILGDLPETQPRLRPSHVGGNIHFGPDGYLYVTIGDMKQRELAQDLSTVHGKILRVNKGDGSAPPDNPFVGQPGADPRVFAYGFRNSFDFTFHPHTGEIYATENGDRTCDEMNIVTAGQDYGWPNDEESGSCRDRRGVPPIYLFHDPEVAPETEGSTVGPTGIEFVSGAIYPSLSDSLLTCDWNGAFLRRLVLGGHRHDKVLSDDLVVKQCRLDIALSPDGIVYYSGTEGIWRLPPQ